MQSQKWQNDLCSFQRQTIQYYSNPSLCPNEWCWRSWNWTVWWRPLRTNAPLKRCLFHYGELECKSMKSRATWSNRQIGLGTWNEAGQRLIEFCQDNELVIANTLFQQHKRRLYTWHHQMVNTEIRLIIFSTAKDGEALYSQQKQDWELTVAQIMNSSLQNSDLNWGK